MICGNGVLLPQAYSIEYHGTNDVADAGVGQPWRSPASSATDEGAIIYGGLVARIIAVRRSDKLF